MPIAGTRSAADAIGTGHKPDLGTTVVSVVRYQTAKISEICNTGVTASAEAATVRIDLTPTDSEFQRSPNTLGTAIKVS